MTNITWFTVPYPVTLEYSVVTTGGTKLTVVDVDNSGPFRIAVSGNHVVDVLVGLPYTFSFEFTEPQLKTASAGGGEVPVLGGRLQVHSFAIDYADTGRLVAQVSSDEGRTSYTYSLAETPGLATASLDFPVRGLSDRVQISVSNDSHLPCALVSARWKGGFTTRYRKT